jgi:hypothetical protein
VGPPVDDSDILSMLPREIAESMRIKNAYIAADGAFHVRGACRSPLWHSLRHAWQGPQALHELYPSVLSTNIPLAQDCLGDQYLLRDESVAHHRVLALAEGRRKNARIDESLRRSDPGKTNVASDKPASRGTDRHNNGATHTCCCSISPAFVRWVTAMDPHGQALTWPLFGRRS